MRHYPFTSSPPSSFTIIIISSFTHCFNHYNNTLSYASPPLPFTISFTIVIAIYIPHHISIPPPHCRPPSLSLSFVNRRDSEQPRGEQQPRRRRRRRRRRRHGRRGGQRRHAPGHLSGKKKRGRLSFPLLLFLSLFLSLSCDRRPTKPPGALATSPHFFPSENHRISKAFVSFWGREKGLSLRPSLCVSLEIV